MATAHATETPVWVHRRPRSSDHHRLILDHTQWRESLVELGKLWAGRPLRETRRYGSAEYRSVDRLDSALHQYAANLAHCFPLSRAW